MLKVEEDIIIIGQDKVEDTLKTNPATLDDGKSLIKNKKLVTVEDYNIFIHLVNIHLYFVYSATFHLSGNA